MRFQDKMKHTALLTCFWLAISTLAHATLWEDNWNRTDADIEGECRPPDDVPIERWECGGLGYQSPICQNLPNRYRTFHSALACANHPSSCVATDPVKKLLRFHGEDVWPNQVGGEGFPMISKQTFSKGGYISAEVRVRAYCGPTPSRGCFFSLNIYNGESNYRGIAYQTPITPSGTPPMEVWRYEGGGGAQCFPNVLTTSSGDPISVGQGTYHTLRIDYYGNEGGKWVYFLDNIVRQIEDANAGNKGSVLQDHPRVGLFLG